MPPGASRQTAQQGSASINSVLTFGPPTDLAAGWDGSLWAIDERGAPHLYDPLGDSWQLHGRGIDGAAQNGDLGVAYFRGPEVVVSPSGTGPQLISAVWAAAAAELPTRGAGRGHFGRQDRAVPRRHVPDRSLVDDRRAGEPGGAPCRSSAGDGPAGPAGWSAPASDVPRYIEFAEDLPRSPTGRVLKRQLRDEHHADRCWDRERAGLALPAR